MKPHGFDELSFEELKDYILEQKRILKKPHHENGASVREKSQAARNLHNVGKYLKALLRPGIETDI